MYCFHIMYYVYCGGEVMILNCIVLALSVSIDSFGIGITYGIKNTKITNLSKLILFIVSLIATIISINFGKIISKIFLPFFTNLLGCLILVAMGMIFVFQSLSKKKPAIKPLNKQKKYNFFIKWLGITIQIIKDPISSDFDKSNTISSKEALYLGTALSLDSLCIGIGSSMLNISSHLFPLLVAFFQLLFISFGNFIGKELKNSSKINDNIWSFISGILLILIGLLKFL